MTVVRRALSVAVVLGLAVLVGRPAGAGAPSDELRVRVEQVVKILEDPALRTPARAGERRAAIRAVAQEIFDFAETTRRCLGRHWERRTAAERDEVTRLFADLLERAYFGRIELYSGEKLVFLGDAIDADQATVRSKLITKQGTEIPIDYRMHRPGGGWRVYDVSIEGISLVANYRAQFDTIIQRSSYQGLVEKLRAKQEENLAAGPGAARVSRQ